MPLYEFECLDCGQPFEKLVRTAAAVAGLVCPACGQPHIQKKLSVFAASVKERQTSQAGGAACAPGGT